MVNNEYEYMYNISHKAICLKEKYSLLEKKYTYTYLI